MASDESSLKSNLNIENYPIALLHPCKRNARTHSKKQIRQIAESIKEFGFNNPVLVDFLDEIIAGHGRVEAAKMLGFEKVPVIRLEHLNDAQIRAFMIADNKIAANAGWNSDLLGSEFQSLISLDTEFDIEVTGFEMAEIDILIGQSAEVRGKKADKIPAFTLTDRVSRLGDLWRLGSHKILCADATEPASFEKLLGSERARLIFADPPYNVPIGGHVSGLGSIKHKEFAMASGEMSEEEFTNFLKKVFHNLANFSADGSIHYICMDWRHMTELLAAGRDAYRELKNLCVWNKTNGGMGSFYRSQHELVFVFKNGRGAHANNIQLGTFGRNRTNVWTYKGINAFGDERERELAMHPTVKPVQLVGDAILDCSSRGDIVLDCFGGSGIARQSG
jgi:DNA modification methylase